VSSVALVHDYLNQRGGAERVVLEMSRIWPSAEIYTSLYREGSTFPEFRSLAAHTSFLDRMPVDRGFRSLAPLYPLAFRSLPELGHELVISSSSGWAHAVRTQTQTFHAVYCHTPARWLYADEHLDALRRVAFTPLRPMLTLWDKSRARLPDLYIANSAVVRERIERLYRRDAVIVHPPVDIQRFTPTPRGERLLVVARLLPYKRVDLIVRAATQAGIGLDVVGTGPALASLRASAGANVTFHGEVDDDTVRRLMERCRALCVAATEDFGIAPVEAIASGKPVVAFAAGGVLESVTEGVTGSFFEQLEPQAVLDAVERCDRISSSPEEIARHAQRFSKEAFRDRLRSVLAESRSGCP
jgi:glycosyltransferase involved in cell wall biosynthesis